MGRTVQQWSSNHRADDQHQFDSFNDHRNSARSHGISRECSYLGAHCIYRCRKKLSRIDLSGNDRTSKAGYSTGSGKTGIKDNCAAIGTGLPTNESRPWHDRPPADGSACRRHSIGSLCPRSGCRLCSADCVRQSGESACCKRLHSNARVCGPFCARCIA